jgi:hypothetical protein
VAIPHSSRLAGNFELRFTAKTAALVDLFATHAASPCKIESVSIFAILPTGRPTSLAAALILSNLFGYFTGAAAIDYGRDGHLDFALSDRSWPPSRTSWQTTKGDELCKDLDSKALRRQSREPLAALGALSRLN